MGSMGSMATGGPAPLAGQLVFVATAARASVVGTGGGVRSAMARAAQLLELDRPSPAMAPRHDATAAVPVGGSRRTPARRRTRRYAERNRPVTAVPR